MIISFEILGSKSKKQIERFGLQVWGPREYKTKGAWWCPQKCNQFCENEMLCKWPCLHLYMSANKREDTWVMAGSGRQAETNPGLAQFWKHGPYNLPSPTWAITVSPKPTLFSQSDWDKPGTNRAFYPLQELLYQLLEQIITKLQAHFNFRPSFELSITFQARPRN